MAENNSMAMTEYEDPFNETVGEQLGEILPTESPDNPGLSGIDYQNHAFNLGISLFCVGLIIALWFCYNTYKKRENAGNATESTSAKTDASKDE